MGIVLDSDVIIRGEKGRFAIGNWLAGKSEERFYVAAVTVAELWHGVERADGARRSIREAYLTAIISSVEVLPYTHITALIHGRCGQA